VLGVHITQVNVKNTLTQLIEIALRYIVRGISFVESTLAVIAFLIKP
jgi:hypothetical protein